MLDRTMVKTVMAAVLEVDAASLGDDASMDTVANWDSLRQMNLVLALEDSFGVSLPDEDAANATSYASLVRALEAQLAAVSAA